MKKERSKKTLTVLILLTLAVIWGHSFLGKEASSEESGFVMELVTPVLEVVVGKGNVTEYLVRKLAHFTEFLLLGTELLCFFALRRDRKDALLLALTHSLFVALTDETIQIFSGRGPMIQDVWLDFSGATVGALTALAILSGQREEKTSSKDYFKEDESI